MCVCPRLESWLGVCLYSSMIMCVRSRRMSSIPLSTDTKPTRLPGSVTDTGKDADSTVCSLFVRPTGSCRPRLTVRPSETEPTDVFLSQLHVSAGRPVCMFVSGRRVCYPGVIVLSLS